MGIFQLSLFGSGCNVIPSSGVVIALDVPLSECCESSQSIVTYETTLYGEWQRRELVRQGFAIHSNGVAHNGNPRIIAVALYCDNCETVCESCDHRIMGPNRDSYCGCENCDSCSECCECFYCEDCSRMVNADDISGCATDGEYHCVRCCSCERCTYCESWQSDSNALCEHSYCSNCLDWNRCSYCEDESYEEQTEHEHYEDSPSDIPQWSGYGLLSNGPRFGVELEVTGISISRAVSVLRSVGIDASEYGSARWRVVSDCSVNRGCEVVSPPLSGDSGFAELQHVMLALRLNGASVDSSCGTHVHHDATDLTGKDLAVIARFYKQSQDAIDLLHSASRRRDGHAALDYCNVNDDETINALEQTETKDDVARALYYASRYQCVNVCAYPKHGTVEFRQHAGTLDFRKLSAWIRFGQSLINAATFGYEGCNDLASLLCSLEQRGLSQSDSAYLWQRSIDLAA